ncbi:calcium-binding protein [Thioalkalivibrio sp. ALMg11]|uniref:calcium-binding protein n=1 Tax=Thioalkalivibrio sp. ALMg11 TaxID=1158165 RepID=UPI000363060C|nr:calcium-binding protein [Thioalkalivibrio sp. ALMg11]
MRLMLIIALVVLAGLAGGYALSPDARQGVSVAASEFSTGFAQGFVKGFSATAGHLYSMGRVAGDRPEPTSDDPRRQAEASSRAQGGAQNEPASPESLPAIDLKGYGDVPNLRQALARDDSGRLREQVEAFTDETDVKAREAHMDALLFEWAGVGEVDPQGRGPHIDGRKLATLEAFLAEEFRQQGSPNPRPGGAAELHKAFAILKNGMYGQLMRQTHLAPYFDGITFALNASGAGFDFSDTTSALQESFERDPARGLTDLFEFERAGGERLRAMGFDPYRLMRDRLLEAGGDQNVQVALLALGWDGLRMDGQGTVAREIVMAHKDDATLKAGVNGDWLLGGDGDNTLNPGPGDDLLYGGAGDNTYRFALGAGHNTLVEMHGDRGRSVLELAPDIRSEDLEIRVEDHELVLAHRNGEDSIRVQNWFGSINPERHRLHAVRLADGQTLDLPE